MMLQPQAETRLPSLCSLLLVIVALSTSCCRCQQQQQNILQSNLISMPALQPPPLYQQHNNILHFWVPEGAPINTPLGNMRSADGQFPYFILAAPGSDTTEDVLFASFTFNLSNGDIATNSVLDRETREYYHFVAVAQQPFAEIKCTITIKDINDNAPMFQTNGTQGNNVVIEVPEGQRGIRKPLPLAIDLDTPQYGIKEFRIVSVSGDTPKGTFNLVEHEAPARSTLANNLADDAESSLTANGDPILKQQLMDESTVLIPSQPVMQSSTSNSATNTNTNNNNINNKLTSSQLPQVSRPTYLIDLEVSQLLDRENQSTYQLVIEVKDGGQPALIGRLNVTVNVLDVNDNDPVFTRKSYECQIKEDTAKGALLLKVQATDVDLDSNGQITYSIKRHSSPSQQQTLINSNSSDNIEASIGAAASAQVRYQQIKQRQATAGTQQQTGSVNGNNKLTRQQGGNEIFEQQATVQDFGANSNFDSKVPPSSGSSSSSYAPEQLFKIDPVKGELYLAGQLDYEVDQLHEFWIEARDHGKPSRTAYASVKVIVINDISDDIPTLSRQFDSRNQQAQMPFGDAPKAEVIASKFSSEFTGISQNNFQNLVADWFAKINGSMLFVIVFFAIATITLPICFVKIRSRQPESDYNDTAGLTLTSNNGQTKQSPNHSTSNEHSNGSSDNHHRHHDHQRRSFVGLNGDGSGFATPSGKLRYQYNDSSNVYHNLYQTRHTNNHLEQHQDSPSNHQMATDGSAAGTMTLHNHHALLGPSGGHHSLEHHHQYPSAGLAHHSSSLTYAHHSSRQALLQQAHHHRSSHHLSSVHQGHNKGGTMNSVGTHHSVHHHPSASPLTASPKTTLSSGLPPNLHDAHHGHVHNTLLPLVPGRQEQLPPTPCNAPAGIFSSWPQDPGSTIGCFPNSDGMLHGTPGSTMDHSAQSSMPLDRWFDLGPSSQLVNAHDWFGSYNWDYLSDWVPEYHNLMPLIEPDKSDY